MIGIDNRSGFPAEVLSLPDLEAQEVPLLLVSSAWEQGPEGRWTPAEKQPPLCLADEYFSDDPASSSLRNEAQTATEKPRIDVIVNGSAYAPGGRPATMVPVELYVGTIAKQVRVYGDRFDAMLGPSLPERFEVMPVIYERAFGGIDTRYPNPAKHAVWRQNPSGVGFRGARSHSKEIRTEYPNLEPARGSLEGPPAGFGIISRAWSPRLELVGTYGAEWMKEQWPLLAKDFDIRHYQSAPSDQQVMSLHTGDLVRLLNFTRDGAWEFAMPPTALPVWLMTDRGRRQVAPRMDTVMIEPDRRQLTMVFRMNVSREAAGLRVREIVVGDVTPTYLRAKERGKIYLDFKKPAASAGEFLE